MSTILVVLHSSDGLSEVGIKIEILGALLSCFRESHRARTNFRKAGGFLYLMSVLVSMEGQLSFPQGINTGTNTSSIVRERMQLIQLLFTCFALAMRFEPANAKLFHQEVRIKNHIHFFKTNIIFSCQFLILLDLSSKSGRHVASFRLFF